MEWITNEVLFYGGIGLAIASVVMAIIYFSISQIRKVRLHVQMDEEYGKKKVK